MKRLVVIMGLLLGCATVLRAEITNYEAKGNLHGAAPLTCVELSSVTNKNTPADIYPGVADCMRKKDYSRATYLYAIATLYSYVDKMRVLDETARQAESALMSRYFEPFPESERSALFKNIEAVSNNASTLGAMCANLRKIGPPDYYPDYMVQHGMGAFLGDNKSGIKSDFNIKETWNKGLAGYLHCP